MSGDHPAYPFVEPPLTGHNVNTGITKRELFAMAAMQGFASKHQSWLAFDELASYSVKAADALIKALNKEGEPTE